MKANQLKETQEALRRLFESEGIKQVICVDDQYMEFPGDFINDVIGNLETLDFGSLRQIPEKIADLKDIKFWEDDEAETWKSQLKKIWEDADLEKKRNLIYQINQLFPYLPDFDKDKDIKHSGILEYILNTSIGVEFKGLSFRDWEKSCDKYLKEEIVNQTIFLFDQDFSKEGGSEEEGIKIIQNLQSKEKQIWCGLLSHTFTFKNEYGKWNEYAKKYNIDKDRFVLIAKDRLTEDQLGFARMLRLTVMNKCCKELKDRVSYIIKETFDESQRKIDELDIYDFEHIVFRSSYEEGIWEPDTLFRLYNIYQKRNARQRAFDDPGLRACTGKIRELSSISISDIDENISELWEVQRQELYEEGAYINRLHLPIDLGDIFQKTDGNSLKKFILLAQPCNLMVRADAPKGKRAHDFNEVVLAEIVNKPGKSSDSYYELLYLDETSGNSNYVDFRKTHTVLLCILDLCVYDKDGKAKMTIGETCPDSVIPSWKMRFDLLKKRVIKIINRYKEYNVKGYDKNILKLSLPKSSHYKSGLFEAKIDLEKGKESLSYDCQRIGRLCFPRAGEMLTKYAHHISRYAFEHDFEISRRRRISEKEKTKSS